jgi:hypothetical protein
MRRQSVLGGAVPAGAGRCARLDPLALPVRFTANDAAADGRVRHVEIARERVLLQRSVRGMAIRLHLPIDAFLGVSVRRAASEEADNDAITVRLEHRDPALAVELFSGPDDAAVIAEWQLWAHVLELPLLVADQSGHLHRPFAEPDLVALRAATPRRRRRNAIRKRRPAFPLRRKPGDAAREPQVHREREIIARN